MTASQCSTKRHVWSLEPQVPGHSRSCPMNASRERQTFAEYIRYLTERGEFGRDADPDEQVRRLTEKPVNLAPLSARGLTDG